MLWKVLLILVFTLWGWLYLRWRRVRRFWADRQVPHDPPYPILGSLTFLLKENPAIWFQRLYLKFGTPYVGIWLFHRPALVVNSPELARRILVKDADVFRNRFLSSGESDPIGGLNIFTVNDPMWTSFRKRLTTVFTSAKLRSIEGLIKAKVNDLIFRIEQEMKGGIKHDFNLRILFSDYTTDVIGEAAFGVRSKAVRTGDSALRKVTRDFMRFTIYRGICWCSIFFYPELVDVFRLSLFPKHSIRFLRRVFRTVIARRGGLDSAPKEPRDLLDALLKMRHDAKADNEEITEDMLLAQATIFLQAGFDTSGSALSFLIYEMAHNPTVQEILYEELMEAKKKYGTDEFDGQHLAEMPYLNAIIKGLRFAQLQIRFAVANICLRFHLKPAPGAPPVDEVKIESKGLLLMPDDNMPVFFLPRN